MRICRLVLPLAAAAVLFTVAASPSAAQRSTTTTAPARTPVEPGAVVNSWALAPVSSTNPDEPGERPFLSYQAAAGTQIKDAVILYNYSNVPLVFRLLATDAFNNADGQFDVPPSKQRPRKVGRWITLPQDNLALPANTSARIDITIDIPANATPGDHAGAILASSPTQGSGPDGKIVNVDRRTGSRVYVRVAGPLTPELAIAKVDSDYRPSLNPFSGTTEVKYRVENQGNVRMGGRHRVEVSALLGLGKKSNEYVDLPELLPGEGFDLTASFKGMPATLLNFATVKLDPAEFEGKEIAVTSRRATALAIPWTVIASAGIAFLLRHAWQRYRGHALAASEARPQPV